MKSIRFKVLKKGKHTDNAIWVFLIVKNERYFLPFFFDHYNALGIENYYVYDDHSSDGSLDYLSSQSNCTVITSEHSYGDVFGHFDNGKPKRFVAVLKELASRLIQNSSWTLIVDADEFFIPPPPFISIPDLVDHLNKIGQQHVTTPLIDFYPEHIGSIELNRQSNPFDMSPYFDRGPLYDWPANAIMPKSLGKGVRTRLLRILKRDMPDLVRSIYGDTPVSAAKCWKVPLLKNDSGLTRIGDHEISPCPPSIVNAGLAHFKFYPDLNLKILSAIEKGQYFNSSIQYRVMQAIVTHFHDRSILSPESVRWESPQSLVNSKLINEVIF